MGGDINAYTSFDQTVYHVTCAVPHWMSVIDAFGTMAKPQKFLKSDFEREREVILEELRKNEDSPGRQLFQRLFTSTFKHHPYGKPVIGYVKTLKAAKVGALESFYKRNYVSGKMGLVLVGPIQDERGLRKKEIVRLLEKHFGAKVLKPQAGSHPPRKAEPALRPKPGYEIMKFDVKTPTVSFSFRVPELRHADIPALDLLVGVLGQGELSRLYQSLFYKQSIVTDVSGGLYVPSDPGMLYFQAEVDSVGKIDAAAEGMMKEFKRIAEEGPTPEELERVIVNAESERLYATQSADGLAGRLGFLQFIMNDMDFDQKYLEDLRAVDSEKLKEVALRYLDPKRMNTIVLVPKDEKSFGTDAIASAVVSHLGRAVVAKPATRRVDPKLPVESFKLPSGIRVVHYERKQSHVFSVHASALGGLRLEPKDAQGLSYMMALTWSKGTKTLSSQEISRIVEGSASAMDGFSGRNSIGLQMTGLARDWKKLSLVFADGLLNPTFPQTEVEQYRRVVEDSIKGIEDHSSQLCSKLFLETLFEKHPYGRLSLGTLESIAAIDSAKLQSMHRQWIRPERLVLSISGDVSRSDLDIWLKEIDQWATQASGRGAAHALVEPENEPELKAPRWVEKSLGREQCHILVGGLGTRIHADDRHAMQILQTLLGGQSGRLFIELREKKSLAYSVAPVSFDGVERGYIGIYIASALAKREEAIAGIRKVLEDLAAKGPSEKEMNRAREFFLGRRAMDLQGDTSLATHYGLETLYGIDLLNEEEFIKKIRSVSAKAVQDACRRYLVEPHQVTSVVG
jgi:zinc protease